jgi:NAD(P)-dependent dehydrogenase (short-subunit alcohol dehydrogenase family)
VRVFPLAAQAEAGRSLRGKVALLVGPAGESGCSLATGLAALGADIVLLCIDGAQERAAEIKRRVEATGRRCLLLTETLMSERRLRLFIEEIVATFGRLDIYISYARPVMAPAHPGQPLAAVGQATLPYWPLMKSALNTMVGG